MSIRSLPYKPTRAVVINCSTKHLSALALASTLRHTPLDVLVVDCESNDGSFEHFVQLKNRHGDRLELVRLPLRPHGLTLDTIFRDLASDVLMLVDSDLEILSPHVYDAMREGIQTTDAYGAGLLHAGGWMGREHHGIAEGTTYFAERMWIPLVLLDVARTRRVLEAGASFLATRVYRDHWFGHRISALLSKRFRMPLLRDHPALLDGRLYELDAPSVREYDTGARVHELALRAGHLFAAIPDCHWSDVHHCHGATRAVHRSPLRRLLLRAGLLPNRVETAPVSPKERAIARLREHYPTFFVTDRMPP